MGRIKRLAIVTVLTGSALGVTAAPVAAAFTAGPAPVPVADGSGTGMYHHT